MCRRLEENYELAEGVCIPRSTLYVHYQDYCNVTDTQAVNAASFGKVITERKTVSRHAVLPVRTIPPKYWKQHSPSFPSLLSPFIICYSVRGNLLPPAYIGSSLPVCLHRYRRRHCVLQPRVLTRFEPDPTPARGSGSIADIDYFFMIWIKVTSAS